VPAARPVPGRRTRLDQQVFRLSARLDARTPSRGCPQWPVVRGLADYGGGPATDLHRLPSRSPAQARRRTGRV